MRLKKMVDSFNHAIDGIIYTVRTQRNMRIHMIITLFILMACLLFDVSKVEFLILAITITMVIGAELFNTAIEATVDMTTNYYHPLAKIAKNVAAGAVLLTAINAVFVGYIIFWDKLSTISLILLNKIKESHPYTIFIVLVIVSILTVIVKAIFGEGTPLKGGMPSGHSALSFSIATAISLITEEPVCIMLSFLMALITAQSRVDSEVHSTFEVIVGALFGILITLLIFTMFKL
ncbi:MAG: diacylglycerol kinase [Clostridium baratii]|uniref:Prokaryotic diacylglycerol kinase family protein n=1 Tax=Clostridium baratii str. Sullivan TaxID=1415775 RepID=A0A0A7FTQ2_9CLOT|nr:diacylglycerol kinase [Clostridium baratii]AIY82992.1 prokaryotic diacylglycerol kinase family protein [Clostridium baratii str. Sullivan]MBS6006453.1 diacylglycerol kinase [Clostridium baratii]MDU1053877.1 diacylglycerol kinase [Clostridium baratii]CUO90438.1 diacylglycerol kinase/PAP2 family protein [Clostridium baratii]